MRPTSTLETGTASTSLECSGTAAGFESRFAPTVERLREFGRLEPDWDSYGADPIADAAISRALALLRSLHLEWDSASDKQVIPYSVAPLASGGVQLEWRGPSGAVELEIDADGEEGCLLVQGEGDARTFTEFDAGDGFRPVQLLKTIWGGSA